MSIIDAAWIVNRARSFLGQNVTGPVDFQDEDIVGRLLNWHESSFRRWDIAAKSYT
jgi:hypothetical protein